MPGLAVTDEAPTRQAARGIFPVSATQLFIIAAACAYYLLNAPRLLGHYDLGWHLAAGDLIRQQRHIPFQDTWSFTAGGREWFNLSWLWDVLASALFQYAHFDGLVLLTVACGGAIAGILARLCTRSGASAPAVCLAVMLVCVLYPSFPTFPNMYLAVSPNMATMLFAVIFHAACLWRRRLFLLPVLMLLWVNLHGGFLIGLFIVAIFCGLKLLRQDWSGLKAYALTWAVCLAATLVNPLGWHIYEGVAATLGNVVQAYITEWWPYHRAMAVPGSLPGVFYMLLFAGLELRQRNLECLEARLLSWLFLFLGFYQFRYMAFFFLFSAVPMAMHLDRLLPRRTDVDRFFRFAAAAMGLALPLVYLLMRPAFALPPMLSAADVGYLESHFPRARLLNHWNYGGLLIFYGRGAVPDFVDGRAATAFPDGVLRDYFSLLQVESAVSTRGKINQAAWDAVLAKYHIDTVLWMNTHEELRRFLVGQRGWNEAYRGAFASIYVRAAKS
jgi:hypothetical protein